MKAIKLFSFILLVFLLTACQKEELVVDYGSEEYRTIQMNVAPPVGESFFFAANTNASTIKDLIIKYAERKGDDTLSFYRKDGVLYIKELMGYKNRKTAEWIVFSNHCENEALSGNYYCKVKDIETDFSDGDKFLIIFGDKGQEIIGDGSSGLDENTIEMKFETNPI